MVKPYDESKYEYGIVHDYVSRDGIPSAENWDLYIEVDGGIMGEEKAKSKLVTREQQSEFEQSKNFKNSIEDFFGFDIDTLHQNIGYTEAGKLVLFDLDGNVTRPKYEEFMKKHGAYDLGS